MSDGWYYTHDEQTHGPVPVAEIKWLAACGRLLPDDLIWLARLDRQRAIPARTVIDLAEFACPSSPRPIQPPQKEPATPTTGPQPVAGVKPDWLADVARQPWKPSSRPAPPPSWQADLPTAEPGSSAHPVPDWLTTFIPKVELTLVEEAHVIGPPSNPGPAVPVAESLSVSCIPTAEIAAAPVDPSAMEPLPLRRLAQPAEARPQPQPAFPQAGLSPEALEKAWRKLADWVELEKNEALIRAGDFTALSQDPFLQEFMREYQRHGTETMKKLCHYLDFMVESRRKFYQQWLAGLLR